MLLEQAQATSLLILDSGLKRQNSILETKQNETKQQTNKHKLLEFTRDVVTSVLKCLKVRWPMRIIKMLKQEHMPMEMVCLLVSYLFFNVFSRLGLSNRLIIYFSITCLNLSFSGGDISLKAAWKEELKINRLKTTYFQLDSQEGRGKNPFKTTFILAYS